MVNTLWQWKQLSHQSPLIRFQFSFDCFVAVTWRSFDAMMALRIIVKNSYFVSLSVSYQHFDLNLNEFGIRNFNWIKLINRIWRMIRIVSIKWFCLKPKFEILFSCIYYWYSDLVSQLQNWYPVWSEKIFLYLSSICVVFVPANFGDEILLRGEVCNDPRFYKYLNW